MKEKVVVAAVQCDCALFDMEANLASMRRAVQQAKEEKNVELVVFPELNSVGYIKQRDKEFGCKYINCADPVPGRFTENLGEMAREFGVYIISGMTEAHPVIPATIYNTAVLIDPNGELVGKQRKVHIPGYEKHYFVPSSTIEVFDTVLGRIGISICYDGQFVELTRTIAVKGAEILVMLWNMPNFSNDPEMLQRLTSTRAFENRFFTVSCNRIGENNGISFFGHSAIADPLGTYLAKAKDEEIILYAELVRDVLIRERAQMPIFRDRRPDAYAALTQPL